MRNMIIAARTSITRNEYYSHVSLDECFYKL